MFTQRREKLKSYGDKWVACVRVMPLPTDRLYSCILQRILQPLHSDMENSACILRIRVKKRVIIVFMSTEFVTHAVQFWYPAILGSCDLV